MGHTSSDPAVEARKCRFETITTLGDGDKGVEARVVYDRKRKAGRLYVLSDEPDDCKHAIVSIPDLPMNILTDGSGQCEFQLDEFGRVRIARLSRMLLRRPRALCSVDAHALTASGSRLELSSGLVVVIRREANRLYIRAHCADHTPPFALVAAQWDDSTTRIVPLKNGACDMTVDEHSDHATIRFYQ